MKTAVTSCSSTITTNMPMALRSAATSTLPAIWRTFVMSPIPGRPPTTAGALKNDGNGNLSWASATSGSGVATQVAFWSGTPGASSTTLTSESQLFWDAANNRLGIGTSTPGYALQVVNNSANDWVVKIHQFIIERIRGFPGRTK